MKKSLKILYYVCLVLTLSLASCNANKPPLDIAWQIDKFVAAIQATNLQGYIVNYQDYLPSG